MLLVLLRPDLRREDEVDVRNCKVGSNWFSELRKSHRLRVVAVVVANRLEDFQHKLVNRDDISSSPMTRPTKGFGLCPLASHNKTPDPRMAAKCKEVAEGSNESDDKASLLA